MLPPHEGPEPGYIVCVLCAFVHLFVFVRSSPLRFVLVTSSWEISVLPGSSPCELFSSLSLPGSTNVHRPHTLAILWHLP